MKTSSKLALITAGILTLSIRLAYAVPATPQAAPNNFYISAGLAYPFVNGSDTKGNIATIDKSAITNDDVRDANVNYVSLLSPEITLGWRINTMFNVALLYAQVYTKIQPDAAIYSTGTEAGQKTSFKSDLKADRFMLKGNIDWHHAFRLGHVFVSPYFGLGIGLSHLAMVNSSVIYAVVDGSLSNRNVWRFAYSAEVGLVGALSRRVNLILGFRYLNLGTYKSSTHLVDLTTPIKKAVSATIYAYEPFVSVAYKF